jgi:hypothetical protein
VSFANSLKAGVLAFLVVFLAQSVRLEPGPVDPSVPTPPVVAPVDPNAPQATAATYVYEKDDTAVPVGVSVGLNRLNREKKILATLFEEDTTDGTGDVPDQYKVPLSAAQNAGLPALVVTNGEKVLGVVKDPRTEEAVWEAVR